MVLAAEQTEQPQERFRRHGMHGLYAHQSIAQSAELDADAARGLRTTLATQTHRSEHHRIATTGNTFAMANGGVVVVVGQPRFKDVRLSLTLEQSGPAAAIAEAYAEYASDVFEQMFGAFSCCIIDSANDRLLAGIDRLGRHTFYYAVRNDTLAFGSDAACLLDAQQPAPSPLNQGGFNYIYFHMVPSPGSIFDEIQKLPAAHCLEFSNGELKRRCYWTPTFNESKSSGELKALGQSLRDTLREAVAYSLPAQGKVGAFLSGGLDSSTVTGIMSELCDNNAEAFSIGFSAKGYDEMAYARITAEHFGVKLNEYYVTPEDVVSALPMIATSYDEPFGNSSALPAYFCARMAAQQGVDTLLAGDGGDEIFAGNERYVFQRVFNYYQSAPKLLRSGLLEPLLNTLPVSVGLVAKARSYVAQANTPLPDRLQNYNFLHQHLPTEIFTDEFLAAVDPEVPLALQREVYHRPEHGSELNRMLYLDWQFTLADNDLRKVSHMCAVAGVDVVYPMIEDVLVEFSCTVPSDIKLKGSDLRHFFKQALTGWLPKETINKDKQGFGLPFGVWMQDYQPLREMAYDNLLKLKRRQIVRPQFIDRTIEMHQSKHAAYYGELVWILTVFELWMDAKSKSGS